jgi:hypothetical protein
MIKYLVLFFLFLAPKVSIIFAQLSRNTQKDNSFCVLLDSIFAHPHLKPRRFWQDKKYLQTRVVDVFQKTNWKDCACFQDLKTNMRFQIALPLDVNIGLYRDMLVTTYDFSKKEKSISIQIHHFIPGGEGERNWPHHFVYDVDAKWNYNTKKWYNFIIHESIE